jgi:hypothetical protein
MKKNVLIFLVLSALSAMIVITGCAPKPELTPTPTAEPTPTAPPADVDCPEVVSTEVYKYYGSVCDPCIQFIRPTNEINNTNQAIICGEGETPFFKIIITFNENIDSLMSSCIYNPSNWTITVKNQDRIVDEISSDIFKISLPFIEILDVEIDGKTVVVIAEIMEFGENAIKIDPETTEYVPYNFCGLICNTTDAEAYCEAVNGGFEGFPYVGVIPTPDIADEVFWELDTSCIIADEMGNYCCGLEGSDCCVEPICEECVEPCPLGSSICL